MHTIGRCLNSVIKQSHANMEIIVIDDGSTDKTKEVITSINDDRIKYFKVNKSIGACAARNYGANKSTGEYIAFQDSDDVWVENKLETQLNEINKPKKNYGLVYCDFSYISLKKKMSNLDLALPTGNIIPDILYFNFISTQTILIRKYCFDKIGGFDPHIKRLQDWDFAIRAAKCFEVGAVNSSLAIIYETKGSITNTESHTNAYETIITKNKELFGRYKIIYSFHCSLLRLQKWNDAASAALEIIKGSDKSIGRVFMPWFSFYLSKFMLKVLRKSFKLFFSLRRYCN
jgi:glycosyltransferase involved in cell wall biosynthesis